MPEPLLIAVGLATTGATVIIGSKLLTKIAGSEGDTIDSEGMKEKLRKIWVQPTKTEGSKTGDWVKIRGDGTTPRTIGYAYRAKKTDVEIVYRTEDNETETEKSKGMTYQIFESGRSFGTRYIGIPMRKLLSKLGKDTSETYDVPLNLVMPGDNYLWISPEAHFVKFNGVKRHLSREGLSRAWETSFAKTHENYLEAAGDIPEQYSVLNNRINGQLRIENMKSENFRKFEKLKNNMDKMDAMDS